ncbi:membrane-associated guanylate kinase, WW and PDZ domain-containing protein 1 isoform X4 [Eurytemora carolleeae]|uniref:membrane-associated guanylate kinase, WW and PDZ domain-containing protein 1 isoform X4 n=1 Tax=Eurytemora carolleeae TaxID=1294199 RepID=UPI000C76B39B|nr:membrane-associated guanylate kinase, WW and PDZ domain-containing protein 1 isoform X4 [Eurytemora carolleeae]|eukprot:XP_023338939.1 membrane-associated guanylate kinase, WW and PDZ domain-containing protein 1-like isoform X4 [Eurytemora affinis]
MEENSDVDRIFSELYKQSEDQTSDRASSIESRFSDFNETVDSFSPSTSAVSNTAGESKTSVSSLVAAFSLMQQESSSDYSIALPSLNPGKDVHKDSMKSDLFHETLKHSATDSFETEYNKTHVTVFEKPDDVTSDQSAHDQTDHEKDPLKASEDHNTSVNEDSDFGKTDENNNTESNIPKSDLSNTNEPSTNEASTQAGLKPKRKTRSNSTQSSGKGYGALNRSMSLDATVQTQRSPEEQKIYELKEEFRRRGEKIKQNCEKSEGEVKKKKLRKEKQRKKNIQTSEENYSTKKGKDERRKKGSINSDIRVYLNTRFPKGGVDHHLQNTIRDNLYARTVPVTTRTPRPEERNGVDYTFLSREEFGALEKSGDLLESGEYDGNHYGTPRPTGDSSLRPEVAPGQHPSSEGKRRRNRSNVEAMAAKHMEAEQENNGGSPDSGATDQTSLPKQQGNSNDAGDGLGPLPHNWERACTDKGEQYFIDHNTGTSHWLDPRLSRVQKRRPEDCEDNELPFGWERIDDPHYGIYYIDHVNRRTQYENPVLAAKAANHSADGIVLRSPPSPPPAPSTYPRPSKPESLCCVPMRPMVTPSLSLPSLSPTIFPSPLSFTTSLTTQTLKLQQLISRSGMNYKYRRRLKSLDDITKSDSDNYFRERRKTIIASLEAVDCACSRFSGSFDTNSSQTSCTCQKFGSFKSNPTRLQSTKEDDNNGPGFECLPTEFVHNTKPTIRFSGANGVVNLGGNPLPQSLNNTGFMRRNLYSRSTEQLSTLNTYNSPKLNTLNRDLSSPCVHRVCQTLPRRFPSSMYKTVKFAGLPSTPSCQLSTQKLSESRNRNVESRKLAQHSLDFPTLTLGNEILQSKYDPRTKNWVINLQYNSSVPKTVSHPPTQNPVNYSQTSTSHHQYSSIHPHYSTPNLQYQSHNNLLYPVPIQPLSKPNTLDLPPPLTPSVITEEDDNQCSLCSHCSCSDDRPFFTRDPGLLRGERLQAKLVKSTRGLGFTIVGGDDSEEEFLQIKSVVPNGPAWLDGRLKTGDVLVFVNGQCVLGFTHHDMVSMFQNINPSEVVKLDVCRGYPLPFDPDDPNTEIVTTVAVNSPDQGDWNHLDKQRTEHDGTASMPDMWRSQSGLEERMRPGSADLLLEPSMNGLDISGGADDPRFGNQDHVTIPIVKGGMGFGFTIADSVFGQKVKKILDRPRCKNLNEGDILVEINNINVQNMNHTNVVQVLKDCPRGQEAAITIQRGNSLNLTKNKFKKKEENGGMRPKSGFLFRSKTPTAELFATQEKEIVPMRPKTPIVDTRNMAQKNWNGELNQNLSPFSRNDFSRASLGVGGRTEQHGSFDMLSEQLSMVGLKGHPAPRSHSPGRELDQPQYQYNYNYQHQNGFLPNGYDSGYGYSGYNGDYPAAPQVQGYSPNGNGYRAGSLPRGRKDSSSFEQSDQLSNNMRWSGRRDGELEMVVVLLRHDSGFGFRIVGGTEEGSQNVVQVSIGHIVSGGAAHMDGRLFSGDEIVAVDGHSVLGASHHVVVEMMGSAAQRGQVQLTIRRRQEGYREGYPYDVTVSRLENEGFGFVIISSVSRAGSTIGRIIPGSPAERCGRLQVGDRILAVNHVDINTLHHEKIINIIKESGYSVTLTVGPPLDDTSSTASTSHREDQEVGAHLGDEDQYFAVELGRGNRGFGFSIRGGREFHSMPLFVLRMAVDGPATADGRLRVGDQLIEINGQSTRNMTHGEAIETIKNGGTAVRLLVKRGKAPPPAILDQTSLSPTSPTPLPHTRPVSSLSQPTNGNGIPPNHEGQGNGNGPVSHSSPRYPPHTYFQQPYWGYHQQSVE